MMKVSELCFYVYYTTKNEFVNNAIRENDSLNGRI